MDPSKDCETESKKVEFDLYNKMPQRIKSIEGSYALVGGSDD